MMLRLRGDRKIENLRWYHPELITQLRTSLATGAQATPDPRRQAFYDVRSGGRVFFIHISPVSGNVMLLATWHEERKDAEAREGREGREGIVPQVERTKPCGVCVA